MAYAFDGATKIITVTAQTLVSVRDVYSRWADWLALSDNSKFLPAFNTLGGNEIDAAAGTSIPIYAYLINGWKIRPQESNHTLSVTDGVLLVDGGGDPFLNTVGAFVVRVNYSQPVQAITVATGGGGGGLTVAQATQLLEIYELHGLLVGSPLVVSPTTRVAGDVRQSIVTVGAVTTVTRL